MHFGLGAAKKIDSAEIRWLSGKIEMLKDLASDEFYAVLEGQGIVAAERVRPALRRQP